MAQLASKMVRQHSALLGYWLSKAVPGVFVFLALPILVATVGTTEYGVYSRLFAGSVIAVSAGTGWLKQSALRATGLASHGVTAVPRRLLLLTALLTALPLAIYAAFSGNTLHEQFSLVMASCALSLSSFASALALGAVQRDGQVRRFAIAMYLKNIVTYLAPLALSLAIQVSATEMLWCAALANLLVIASVSYDKKPHSNRSFVLAKSYWGYGAPLSAWLLVSGLVTYSDRFLISILADPTQAGTYAAISDIIVRGISVLIFPITMAAHPEIMRIANSGDGLALRQVLAKWMRITQLVCVVAVLVFGVAGYLLLGYIGGEVANLIVIILLTIGATLWQYALIAHKPHEVAGLNGELLKLLLAALAIQIVFAFLPLPIDAGIRVAGGMCVAVLFYVGAVVRRRPDLSIVEVQGFK